MGLLRQSWLIGRFRDVEVHLHSTMVLLIPLIFVWFHPTGWLEWLNALVIMAGLFVCVLLHEAGHTVAARLCGIGVSKIVLWPLGGFTNMLRSPEKPWHRFIIGAAGPLVNVILALGLALLWLVTMFFPILMGIARPSWAAAFSDMLSRMAFVNVMLVVFNLLPIHPLDGGKVLNALMEMLFGKSVANIIAIIIGIPLLLGLIILGIVTQDYILLAVCILMGLSIGTLDPRSRHWMNLGITYLFNRTGYYHLNGDYDEAIRSHTRALQKNPRLVSHLLGRAAAFINILAYDLAQADIEAALQLSPDHLVALGMRGDIYVLKKEYDLALDCYSRVKTLKPNWALAYFGCGGVYIELKDHQRALDELNRTIELLPLYALFFVIRSLAHYRLQNIEAAHHDQAEALRLSPQDGLIMRNVNQSVYAGYLDWAQDFYGWVLEKHPDQWRAYQGRGDAYAVNNQPDAAVADYSQALGMAPREAILYLQRGLAHQKMGHNGQAADDFRQVLTLTRKSHLRRQAGQLLKQVAGAL